MWTYLTYAFGFGFSVFVGHCFTKKVVGHLDVAIKDQDRQFRWLAEGVGYVERTLYTASWIMGEKGFIPVWLALKVAAQWKRWTDGEPPTGRAVFSVFLIGNGLSISYAVVGAKWVEWIKHGEIWFAIVVSIALSLGTLALDCWAQKERRKGN